MISVILDAEITKVDVFLNQLVNIIIQNKSVNIYKFMFKVTNWPKSDFL